MWKTTVRQNLGIIFAFAVLVVVRTRRQLLRRLGKIVTFGLTHLRRTTCVPLIAGTTTTSNTINPAPTAPTARTAPTVPATVAKTTTYDHQYPNSVLYFRRRFLGTEYFVVQSAYVAATLSQHAEYFQNASFVQRTFQFCNGTNTSSSSLKRLQHVVRALINDYRNKQNAAGAAKVAAMATAATATATATAGVRNNTTNSSASMDASADKAYQKFAMEMTTGKGDDDERPGHLYRTSSEKRQRQQLQQQQTMELPTVATVTSNTKNGYSSIGRELAAATSSLETMVPALRSCVKEMVILLEAKANRKTVIDVREYGYRHAVNVLAVCLFGKTVDQLTGSRCTFYTRFDELYEMWAQSENVAACRLLDGWLRRLERPSTKKKRAEEVIDYFRSLVIDCVDQNTVNNWSLLRTFVDVFRSAGNDSREELIESLNVFVVAFSISVVEVLAGSFSIIMHELSHNAELQEKIRDKDKMKFSLDGLPCFDIGFLSQPLYVNSLIKETFKTFPVDPFIQLTCKRVYRIPNTNFRINPKSVVLIPVNVLQTDYNLYPSMDSFNHGVNQEMEKEYGFITDSEMQSFFVFVHQFVDVCLKTTLPSLIHEYEFKTDVQLNYEYGTSCRFSTLPSALPLRAARVEKRGKVVVFEESLKAFHASRDVPFLSKIGL